MYRYLKQITQTMKVSSVERINFFRKVVIIFFFKLRNIWGEMKMNVHVTWNALMIFFSSNVKIHLFLETSE